MSSTLDDDGFDIIVELTALDHVFEIPALEADRKTPVEASAETPEDGVETDGPMKKDNFFKKFFDKTFYHVMEEGIRGDTQFQMICLYMLFTFVLVSAEYAEWAPDIRFFNLVPYFFVSCCVLESSKVIYCIYGNLSLLPVFLNLVPFAVLLIISREAHMQVAVLFFAGSMIIYMQSASSAIYRVLVLYTFLFLAIYAAAVYAIEWFYVDTTGSAGNRGRVLSRPVLWGEEATFMMCVLFLGLGYLVLARYVRKYAHEVAVKARALVEKEKEVKKLREEIERYKPDDLGDTPLKTAMNTLTSVKESLVQRDDKNSGEMGEKIDQVLRILARGDLYEGFSRGGGAAAAAGDQQINTYLRQTFLKEPVYEIAPLNTAYPKPTPGQAKFDIGKELNCKFNPEDVRDAIDLWDFDPFSLLQMTNGHPLIGMGFALFHRHNIIQTHNIDEGKLWLLLKTLEEGYRATNPYHNALHAADVAQTMNYFIVNGGLDDYCTEFDTFIALFSAMIHDFQHPGVNNGFLINTADPLAIRYNDRSVLEQHHLAAAFTLMGKPDMNILETLELNEYKYFRSTTVKMVLATDMANHQEISAKFIAKCAVEGVMDPKSKTEDKHLLLEVSMKCADISNPAKPYNICHQWAIRIRDEFYMQGDEEKRRNIPVSMFMDREQKEDFAKTQSSFIQFVVAPLYNHYCKFLPKCVGPIENIQPNQNKWKAAQDAVEEKRKRDAEVAAAGGDAGAGAGANTPSSVSNA